MQERSLHAYDLPRSPSNGEMSRDAYALLAQANLLRMRGCWPEAIEKCMAALKLAPEHPSAQSLLGDIYENQGCLDDAIQWYRMALDVQPESPADKVKLARLLDRKARVAAPLVSPSTAQAPEDFSVSARTSPETLLRRAAFAAGIVVVMIIVASVLVTRLSSYAKAKPRELSVPAIVVPTVTTPSAEGQPNVTPAVADPAEQSLLASLQAAPDLANQGIVITGVQTDPRTGRLILTAVCQSVGQTPMTRSSILRDSLHVIQAASRIADPRAYSQFTVRCLLSSAGGGSTPLVFTADASRAAAASQNPNLSVLTDDQVLATFSNPWWSPAIAP